MKPGDITAANQPPEIVALAKYLAHLAGWGTEPIPKKYQSEASAIRAALHAAGFKIIAREPTEAMDRAVSDPEPWRVMWDAAP